MSPLLEQFLSEAKDFLQSIAEKLMELEKAPTDAGLMTELFRFVHTLKGNSGLFEFPEMTRVLHAGEDLLDGVRNGRVNYSQELADRLLDAMDFVSLLCDEIEVSESISSTYSADSVRLTDSLRQLNIRVENDIATLIVVPAKVKDVDLSQNNIASSPSFNEPPIVLAEIPENVRMTAYRLSKTGQSLHWLVYKPLEECFFQGEDPFFQARQTPDLLWGGIVQRESWPNLSDMDAYRCMLDFHILSTAPKSAIDEYFRYIPEQIIIEVLSPLSMIIPTGDPNGGPVYEDFVSEAIELLHKNDIESFSRAVQTMLELSSPDLWLSSALRWLLLVLELEPNKLLVLTAIIQSISSLTPTNWLDLEQHVTNSQPIIEPLALQTSTVISQSSLETDAILSLLSTQREILQLPTKESWEIGRLKSVVATLKCCLMATQGHDALSYLETAADQFYSHGDTTPLILWIDNQLSNLKVAATDLTAQPSQSDQITHIDKNETPDIQLTPGSSLSTESNGDIKFGRRAEDTTLGAKSLKVDQVKIDRLMNLIGEMVVSKNALPYLANRAETIFGVRELSREIKTQYGVINRIAEEMQDAIMQVRMMPVSFVFQRFPRLVRDISRKLGKEVNLILEGEDTEADKNIIESLGDPLVHIVRNSLDHGFELPEVRRAVGKPAVGTLIIRATQVSDRVIIEIIDDGKGIDPEVIKRKAYEKGILNEAALERISDLEAVNLVFAAGFSTAEVISDLSGRGVGMDVVRTTVENVNGSLSLESEKGKGTRLSISLPLSMAVTNVMIIECYGQQLGVPMDSVVETVRIPRVDIRCIKQSMATVLRGRIVPLKSVNQLLGINAQPRANEDDELAILVVRVGNESLGLLVDNFRETIDIILKPMTGLLAEITAYSGSALMGDGSVLLVLNIKDLLQ